MGTIHFKSGALYLGDPAVPIGEAAEAMLEIEFDVADDSAFADAWETRLKGALRWAGAAQANFDTASSQLYDVAVSSTLSRLYLYPNRSDPSHYHGRCWPKLTIDGSRTDAGRLTAAFKGSGALDYVSRTTYQAAVLADSPYLYLPLTETAGPTAADLSGNARHGTYSGTGVTYRRAGCTTGGYAVDLDGTSGNVAVSTALSGFNPSPHAFTVEFWIKPDTVTGSFYLIDAGLSPRFVLRIVNGALQWADNGNVRVLDTIAAATCQHVAVVINGSIIRSYVNGSPDTAVDLGAGFTFGTPFASATKFGSAWDDGAFTDGTVSDLAIYSTALSGAQILAHYQAA